MMEHSTPAQYGATCYQCGVAVPLGFLHVHECDGQPKTSSPVPDNSLPSPNRDRAEDKTGYISHLCARINDYAARRDTDQLEITARMLAAAVDEFVAESREPK